MLQHTSASRLRKLGVQLTPGLGQVLTGLAQAGFVWAKTKKTIFWKDPTYLRTSRSVEIQWNPVFWGGHQDSDSCWPMVKTRRSDHLCCEDVLACVACAMLWYDPSVHQQRFYSPASFALSTVTFQYPVGCLLANDHTFDHMWDK